MSLRNLFGRAEQLRVMSATTFPHWGQAVQLQFTKPYFKDIQKKYVPHGWPVMLNLDPLKLVPPHLPERSFLDPL